MRLLFKMSLKFFHSLFCSFFLKYEKDPHIESIDALFVKNYNKCDSFIGSFVCSFIHSFSEVKYVGKLFEDFA